MLSLREIEDDEANQDFSINRTITVLKKLFCLRCYTLLALTIGGTKMARGTSREKRGLFTIK